MKKFFTLILLVLLPMVASAFTGEAIVDGIKYFIITKANTAEVRTNHYSGKIVIPSTIEYEGVICNVTSIGDRAFESCSSLTSVTIPNSVTSIGEWAFERCSSLTSVNIPESVTSIGKSVFRNCSSLTSVTIPNSVTSIGGYAFYYCTGLISVTIPDSVTSIGNAAFSGCSGLTSIKVEPGNTKYDSRNNCNAIIETTTNTLIAGCKNTIIPNSVTSIGNSAFSGYSGLTSVTIPNSVTSIGEYAFSGCSGLTSVAIPNSVTSIGYEAFQYCWGLTSVTIPNSVTSIGNGAFYGCSGLTSVTIGSGVKKINDRAFANCQELTDVYCYAENVPSTSSNTFENSYIEYVTLHVPAESIEQYKAKVPWNGFGKIIALTEDEIDGIKEIESLTPGLSKGEGDWYDLNGRKLAEPQKGVNIIRYSDGTSRKVLVK